MAKRATELSVGGSSLALQPKRRMKTRSSESNNSPPTSPLRDHSLSKISEMSQDEPSEMTGKSSNNQHDSAPLKLFTPISQPVLRTIYPPKVAKFLKDREGYEVEVTVKKRDVPTLTIVPLTRIIDQSLLKSLIYMREFTEIAHEAPLETISSAEVMTYIKSLVAKGIGKIESIYHRGRYRCHNIS